MTPSAGLGATGGLFARVLASPGARRGMRAPMGGTRDYEEAGRQTATGGRERAVDSVVTSS